MTRLFGIVVNVGEGVGELKPGNVVELSRWDGAWWIKRPGEIMTPRVYGPHAEIVHRSLDGRVSVHAQGNDPLVIAPADWVMYKIADTIESEPGIFPLADCVLVRHLPRPMQSKAGVSLHGDFHRWPYPVGQVESCGARVADVHAGDYVVTTLMRGALFKFRDGTERTLVRESDIQVNCGESVPSGMVCVETAETAA